jgi:hypothetical protein
LVLQFQFADLSQFQAKTYHVVPSNGVYSIDRLLSNSEVPFNGFPNDSLLIGYYHIATDAPKTLTFDEDQEYMKNQITLKSGHLEITIHSSEYEFSGSFIDAQGEEVKIKFKAKPFTGVY